VHERQNGYLMHTAYEYDLLFQCNGIHEIKRGLRRRLKRPQPPLRQLPMFADAAPF
jgi:hypothetical protein